MLTLAMRRRRLLAPCTLALIAACSPLLLQAKTPAHRTSGAKPVRTAAHAPAPHTAAAPQLRSASALVLDAQTQAVLYARKADEAVPIASITKLMTSLVVLEAKQDMDEVLVVGPEEQQATRGNRSHLAVGTRLTRAEAMHLALMSSENRAAHLIGRSYPGGLPALVNAMNAKALQLGMSRSHFVEPTGLSSQNVASPQDLTRLVLAAARQPLLREYSTDEKYTLQSGKRMVQFVNTDALVKNPNWDISLQKTGYISEGGKCLVLKTLIAGREVIIVLLNSFGAQTRLDVLERDVIDRLLGGERVVEVGQHLACGRRDVELLEADPERGGQARRPVLGLGAGGESRHRDGVDVGAWPAEPVHRLGRHDQGVGGVEPAADPDDDLGLPDRLQALLEPGDLDVVGLVAVLRQPLGVVGHEREAVDLAPQAEVGLGGTQLEGHGPEAAPLPAGRGRDAEGAPVVVEGALAQSVLPDPVEVDVGPLGIADVGWVRAEEVEGIGSRAAEGFEEGTLADIDRLRALEPALAQLRSFPAGDSPSPWKLEPESVRTKATAQLLRTVQTLLKTTITPLQQCPH